jgi:hypothetical protein
LPTLAVDEGMDRRYAESMSGAAASALREEIDGQWSGYWVDPGRQPPLVQPTYRPTGAILRRVGETNRHEFVCLDLVLVESAGGFVWLPLSEAGRYTYAHSLGLLQHEPWRLAIWEGASACVYEAAYAESLSPNEIATVYGPEAQGRARPDRPAVQLRLRRLAS